MKHRLAIASLVAVMALGSGHAIAAEAGKSPVPRTAIRSVQASSFENAMPPELALDDKPGTRWSSSFSDPQWLKLEFAAPTTVCGVNLQWESAFGKAFQIQVSDDAKTWRIAAEVTDGPGGKQALSFSAVTCRFLRLYGLERATGWGYSLIDMKILQTSDPGVPLSTLRPFDSKAAMAIARRSASAFLNILPEVAEPGIYPRWAYQKQNYWTVVGTLDSWNESQFCEDGAIEPSRKSFSLMPYLLVGDKFITAVQSEVTQSLDEGYLPIPTVTWTADNVRLIQTVFASGGKTATTYAIYRLENPGKTPISGQLFVLLRPFQANPPWQAGGMTDVFALEASDDLKTISVNGRESVIALEKPDGFGAADMLESEITDLMRQGRLPEKRRLYTPLGMATGAWAFSFKLAAGETREIIFAMPLDPSAQVATSAGEVHSSLDKERAAWQEALNRFAIDIPDEDMIRTMKTNLAYLLIHRDGAALQPGSRNYERTWARDGAEMAVSLMRTGHMKEAREYLLWVAERQQIVTTGEVLPMINADGSAWDWGKSLKEYDGQGCYVYAVAEYWRFTHDQEFLKRLFPYVEKALRFLETLRKERLTDVYKSGDKRRFYGILPLSVSHEGYVAPGAHSYWDDFWALKGWRDGQELARAAGHPDLVPWMQKEESELRQALLDSIKLTQEWKKVRYIPGSADFCDSDATSATIALWPTDQARYLPADQLNYTIDQWYERVFLPERMDGKGKIDLTPYEIRNATAYVILGQKARALQMIRYYLALCRPKPWNGWGEVVHHDYFRPKYVGDMPHGWEAAIYINFVRNLFLYEDGDTLVLGAGIDEAWLQRPEGISVRLPAYGGEIRYTVKRENGEVRARIEGSAVLPPNGCVFRLPARVDTVKLNGVALPAPLAASVPVKSLPVDIVAQSPGTRSAVADRKRELLLAGIVGIILVAGAAALILWWRRR